MARPPLRSGIIGTGFMGRVHTRAVRSTGGIVVAYAGRDLERTREAAQEENVPLALTADELVAHPDVDIVHICTPNAQHLPLALVPQGGRAGLLRTFWSVFVAVGRTHDGSRCMRHHQGAAPSLCGT